MHFSFVRLAARTRTLLTSNETTTVDVPAILFNRHYASVRPLVSSYLRSSDDAHRIRALSALHVACAKVRDPIAIDGIDAVFRLLGSTEEEIQTVLEERRTAAASDDAELDDTLLDRLDYNLSALRRIKAVYNGHNSVAEFDAFKAKSAKNVGDLITLLPQLSNEDFDRLLHGMLRAFNRALDFEIMDRFVLAMKERILANADDLHGHTFARALYLLMETGDRDDEFRKEITPHIIRTLSSWSFREAVLGFQSIIRAQKFDDPSLFGAMLDHIRLKTPTATPVQVTYAVKLLRKNEIRHTALLTALSARTRLLVHSFSIDDLLENVEGMLDLAFSEPELLAIVLDHMANLVTTKILPWYHIHRIALILERVPDTTPGRSEISFALGRHSLVSMRTIREETLDIIRSLCWEYRKG